MFALRPKAAVLAGAAAIALSLFSPGKPAQACSVEPYLGAVCLFGGNFEIRGFIFAAGQLLPISQNNALFSIYGTTYGGDGRTTFGIPDLRGRMAIGFGTGPGLSKVNLGQRGGVETVTQTLSTMVAHTHVAAATVNAQSADATTVDPFNNVWAKARGFAYSPSAPNTTMRAGAVTVTNTSTGGSQAVNIRNPYLGLNWLVAITGIFPSRN